MVFALASFEFIYGLLVNSDGGIQTLLIFSRLGKVQRARAFGLRDLVLELPDRALQSLVPVDKLLLRLVQMRLLLGDLCIFGNELLQYLLPVSNALLEVFHLLHDAVIDVVAAFGARVEIAVYFAQDFRPVVAEVRVVAAHPGHQAAVVLHVGDFSVAVGVQDGSFCLLGVDFEQHAFLLSDVPLELLFVNVVHLFIEVELLELLDHAVADSLEGPQQLVVGFGLLVLELSLHLIVVGQYAVVISGDVEVVDELFVETLETEVLALVGVFFDILDYFGDDVAVE